jgi:hypothetical protein
MAERPFQPPSTPVAPVNPADPLERAEGAALRDPIEQRAEAAAPRIATDAEPVRPTPDDALHEMPPDLTGHPAPGEVREATAALHWGALAAIGVVLVLFTVAFTRIFLAG